MQLLSLSYKERGRAQRRAWHMTQTGQTPIYLLPRRFTPLPPSSNSHLSGCQLFPFVDRDKVGRSQLCRPATNVDTACEASGGRGREPRRKASSRGL